MNKNPKRHKEIEKTITTLFNKRYKEEMKRYWIRQKEILEEVNSDKL